MGLFDWLKRSTAGGATSLDPKEPLATSRVPVEVTAASRIESSSLVKVAGSTTNSRDAAAALARRHRLADRTALVLVGSAQPEPNNRADPKAVAIVVEGERIGYLPGYVAKSLAVVSGSSLSVPIQVFCATADEHTRVEAWVWLGKGKPQWKYSSNNPPPMSTTEKRAAHHDNSTEMVREALAGGGFRAEDFRRGMVNGVHYLELVEPIKQLKREGKLEEALRLCYAAIDGAENSREGTVPAPFYTEQAAIVHRKLGQRHEEIAVLRRYARFVPEKHRKGNSLVQRLMKLES